MSTNKFDRGSAVRKDIEGMTRKYEHHRYVLGSNLYFFQAFFRVADAFPVRVIWTYCARRVRAIELWQEIKYSIFIVI